MKNKTPVVAQITWQNIIQQINVFGGRKTLQENINIELFYAKTGLNVKSLIKAEETHVNFFLPSFANTSVLFL